MDDKKLFVSEPVGDAHSSPLRAMMAEAQGEQYVPLESLGAAQQAPDGVVILEGDEGSTVYVVCPASQVRCAEEALELLLRDVDALYWNDASMARICFERQLIGSVIPGGMGGGLVTDGVWMHEALRSKADAIRAVIEGARPRLSDDAD
jgi:hypothetical protein